MRTLDRNKTLFGIFVELPTPASVEIAGATGWDFVVIDCEHAAIAAASLPDYLRAAEAYSIPAIVRIPSNTVEWIQAALDSGAAGVQIPQISSLQAARQAVEMARFHPIGKRGLNPFVRAARYSTEPSPQFMERSNREVALILQLESVEAVIVVDEIVKLPGIDAIFLGPYDLSQSLGKPGEVNHRDVLDAGERVLRSAAEAGLAPAVFVNTAEASVAWAQRGARWISYSTDSFQLAASMRKLRNSIGG